VVGARRRSRRAFFRGAGITLLAGSPGVLAACGDDKNASSSLAKPGAADVDVLNAALDLEYTIVAAYKAGTTLLRGSLRALGEQFLAQEREHADALVRAIKSLGGTPNRRKARYDFPPLGDQAAFLGFANDLEHTAVTVYLDAIPKLTDAKVRGTAAAIVTTEAEHISVLLGALNKPQVPSAFVTGAP
jgi:bacterioferritin (cytochrome b1)